MHTSFDQGVMVFIATVVIFLCDKDAEMGENPVVGSDDVFIVCRDGDSVSHLVVQLLEKGGKVGWRESVRPERAYEWWGEPRR